MASAHSEAAKTEQIITEFYAKTLQIVLESRCAYMSSRNYSGDQALLSPCSTSSSSPSVRPRDKWFNLALRECPATLESSDLWSHNNLEPMVVDVVLVQRRPVDFDAVSFSPRKDRMSKDRYSLCTNLDREESFGCDSKSQRVIERWVVHYENRKGRDTNNCGNRRLSNSNLYKKTILLLRSLYVTVRLLPAFKIYHDLNSSSQIRPLTLAHRVSSFVEPFTRTEEADMQRFVFTPVDTSTGRLCLSVLYRSSLPDIFSSEPSTPMSPQLIPNYVGSPLTDPVKSFPSLPVTRSTSQSSPSSSASPTHRCLPPHPHEKSSVDKKDPNFDEFFPLPLFSLLPSPPISIPTSHSQNPLLRSESAPVHLPAPKQANNSSAVSKQNLPPSRSKSKSTGVTRVGTQDDKFSSLRKEETRRRSGIKVSISRCLSQSLTDDFDEFDFACAFDVDEDETTDLGIRPESLEQSGGLCNPVEAGGLFSVRKSQDAAVGELVLMLKKAQPLHQDTSKSALPNSRPDTVPDSSRPSSSAVVGSASLLVVPKTTADALEELQRYRDLKNLLLTQGTISYI